VWGVHRRNQPPEVTELPGVGMSADAVNLQCLRFLLAYAFIDYGKTRTWIAHAVLKHLGELKRPYLTAVEDKLLGFIEQECGIVY